MACVKMSKFASIDFVQVEEKLTLRSAHPGTGGVRVALVLTLDGNWYGAGEDIRHCTYAITRAPTDTFHQSKIEEQ
jgi:hypothetical protein